MKLLLFFESEHSYGVKRALAQGAQLCFATAWTDQIWRLSLRWCADAQIWNDSRAQLYFCFRRSRRGNRAAKSRSQISVGFNDIGVIKMSHKNHIASKKRWIMFEDSDLGMFLNCEISWLTNPSWVRQTRFLAHFGWSEVKSVRGKVWKKEIGKDQN